MDDAQLCTFLYASQPPHLCPAAPYCWKPLHQPSMHNKYVLSNNKDLVGLRLNHYALLCIHQLLHCTLATPISSTNSCASTVNFHDKCLLILTAHILSIHASVIDSNPWLLGSNLHSDGRGQGLTRLSSSRNKVQPVAKECGLICHTLIHS